MHAEECHVNCSKMTSVSSWFSLSIHFQSTASGCQAVETLTTSKMSTTPMTGNSAAPLPHFSTRVMEYWDIKQRLTRRQWWDRVQRLSKPLGALHLKWTQSRPATMKGTGPETVQISIFQIGLLSPLLFVWDLAFSDVYQAAVTLHSSLYLHGDYMRYVHNCLGLWDVFFSMVVSSCDITFVFNFVISMGFSVATAVR